MENSYTRSEIEGGILVGTIFEFIHNKHFVTVEDLVNYFCEINGEGDTGAFESTVREFLAILRRKELIHEDENGIFSLTKLGEESAEDILEELESDLERLLIETDSEEEEEENGEERPRRLHS